MVHVIVGAANALGGVINAARAQVPMLFSAGRTPLSEGGTLGSRDRHIHWAQEAYDQARHGARVREVGLRAAQLRPARDRGRSRARHGARPSRRGPCISRCRAKSSPSATRRFEYAEPSRLQKPGLLRPAPADIDEAAQILAGARNPIIITKAAGRDPDAVPALVKLAETLGAPVFGTPGRNYMNFPSDHPLLRGLRRGAASGGRGRRSSSSRRTRPGIRTSRARARRRA